jgi:hypothetical protein
MSFKLGQNFHIIGSTLVSDPATTHGCVMAFTTWSIPRDPRRGWTEES